MTTAHRSYCVRDLGAGVGVCSECKNIGATMPAHYLVHLFPEDFEGLNMGPDVECEIGLCHECTEAIAPWVLTVEGVDRTIAAAEKGELDEGLWMIDDGRAHGGGFDPNN